jgi:crossover junction endodeoxyribonuclease RuvC
MTSVDRCILGIDPGTSGAIAFYFPGAPSRVCAEDVPVAAGEINAAGLADRIRKMRPDVAVIERVAAMPGQGVSSTFKFGASFGVVCGVLATLEIPCHRVSPAVWKKHFRLSADKEASRALALRLFPATAEHFSKKRDHNRAEAALLARYGCEVLGLLGQSDGSPLAAEKPLSQPGAPL